MKLQLAVLSISLNAALFSFPLASAQAQSKSQAQTGPSKASEGSPFQLEILTEQKDTIWGFDFLADGRILFTERSGALKIFDPKTKAVITVEGTPAVHAEGQGGLLDVRVHPSNKNQIFMTYSEPIGRKATTALASATLTGRKLTGFKKLFSAIEPNTNDIHFGSRLEFDGKGFVYFTVGDRNERDQVQDLKYHLGKILRLKEDGSVPTDNPFVKQKDARPEIWSVGHRSPQGLVRDPANGDLWETEMGPRGGDELNLIQPGKNYGWPVVTYGKEYSGLRVGKGEQTKAGMENPVAHWVPSISPSGTTIYTGDLFPKWKGNLFIGNLSGMHLRRLVLDDRKVIQQEELLKDQNLRIRNLRTGPEGALYLSTDDGKIARLMPIPSK